MPAAYVFPGGCLEPEDVTASGFDEAALSASGNLAPAVARQLPSFARAALRETYEETGLLLGRPAALRENQPAVPTALWRAYAAAGLIPAFDALRLIGRAITPPGLPLRFHARFFLADGALAHGEPTGNGELEDLAWVPLTETARLQMPGVTRRALRRALRAIGSPGGPEATLLE